MSWRSTRSGPLLALALLASRPWTGQGQSVREVGVGAMAAASKPAYWGAGLAAWWRDARRTRLGSAISLGAFEGGGLGVRADVAWHFLLDPGKRGGAAVYGGGGLSAAVRRGDVKPYLLLVLGAENSPGGARGSYVEVGVGGGLRMAVGMRWRKRNAPNR